MRVPYEETKKFQDYQARKARREERAAEERIDMLQRRKKYTERQVDNAFKKCVEEVGGWTTKMHPVTNAGIPDRLVHFRGTTFYVELKATGEQCSDLQIEMHKRLRSFGIQVYVLDTKITNYWDLFVVCYTTYEGSHYKKNPFKDKTL